MMEEAARESAKKKSMQKSMQKSKLDAAIDETLKPILAQFMPLMKKRERELSQEKKVNEPAAIEDD